MAKSSYDKYYEDLYKSGKGSVSAQETALKNAAKKEKELINQTAEEEINAITEDYNSSVADVNKQYEDAFKRNATQRALNERYLERKSAEMGLTDSGLNRTQQTANQLSYANQNAALDAGLLKDVNTLSAAMKARKLETEQKRRSDIAAVESNLESSRAKLWSDYDSNVRSTAEDLYKSDADTQKAKTSAMNTLISNLRKEGATDLDKQIYIKNYVDTYGVDSEVAKLAQEMGYVVLGTGDLVEGNKIYTKNWTNQTIARNAVTAALSNKNRPLATRLAYFARYVDMYGVPEEQSIKHMLGNSEITIEQLLEAL